MGSIDKAFRRMEGVSDVSVSLAHEEALVQYEPDRVTPDRIRETLVAMGYTVRDPNMVRAFEEQRAELRESRSHLLKAGRLDRLAEALFS